ncbi:hypothetical protein [Carnobacterium maltaromaticum]|uniref:hypothetical protein n=1 Tax=Carnobacterium maltaromaticum TaxID=2751 RepID=UPI00026C82BF|nr:hypothetical protein [Carnobacterium maltaromaticum]
MEKTITIADKQVRLKSTAATPKRFKIQFGRDYFAELLKFAKVFEPLNNLEESEGEEREVDLSQLSYDSLKLLDFDVLYDIVWVLAKSADNSIPDPLTWLDQFEVFPLAEIMPEIQELLSHSIKTEKK